MIQNSKYCRRIINSIYVATVILIGSILILAAVDNAAAGTAPIIYWRFDETSGSTAFDSSGNNNNGTVIGTAWTAGKINNGLNFSGNTNSYIIKNPVSNFPTSEITAEFWMKSSDTSNAGTPFSYATSASDNEFRIVDYTNFEIDRGSSSVVTGISANDGAWHLIAVTWKASDGNLILYKDGINVYTGTLASGEPITSGGSLVLGQDQDIIGGGFELYQAFKGLIDEVKVYNRILSASEILTEYQTVSSDNDLAAYYKLDETNGTYAIDSSGNGNSGALTNFRFDSTDGWTSGRVNNALKLGGLNDYVDAGNNSSVSSITSAITIESWVYLNSTTNLSPKGDIVGKSGMDGADQYQFGILNSRQLNFSSEGGPNINSIGSIKNDMWQHIAVTYNKSKVSFYINGVLDSSFNATGGLSPLGGNDLVLGKSGKDYGNLFNGIIDEVKIYSRTLSAAEILKEYQGVSLGGLPTPTLTPTPTPVPTPGPTQTTIEAGFRSEQQTQYSGYMDANLPSYWACAGQTMASKWNGSQPTGIWIISKASTNSTDRNTYLDFPSQGETWPNIRFYSTDKSEDYLTAFDKAGIKIYLEAESSDANVSTLIKLIMDRYSQHPSVVGFGIDVEWYKYVDNPNGKPVTNAEVESWIDQIRTYNPNYKLFIKHWDATYLPTIHYANVFYINDAMNHECLTGCSDPIMDKYKAFADYFPDAKVGIQIGYSQDRTWWGSYSDPAKSIGDALIANIPNLEGIYWVDSYWWYQNYPDPFASCKSP